MGNVGGRLMAGALAVGLLVSVTACEEETSGELSVLSYNVAGLPQQISNANPERHIPMISPLLNDYDVVLTQEDFDWWVEGLNGLDFVHYRDRLRAEATHEHRSSRHPGPEAVGITPEDRPQLLVGDGLGVLSRFAFTEEGRIPWDGCFGSADTSDRGAADCLAMKGFSMVRMTLAPGVEVDVYNLHGEAGATLLDQQLQEAGFVQLAEFIQANSEGRAVILGGDTNLHTESNHPDGHNGADTRIWAEFLEATGLTDACHAVGCSARSLIDKVAFRSGDGVDLTALTHDLPRARFRDPEGNNLSDHPPLVVNFAWEAT